KLLLISILVHVVPNILMKVFKNTHLGHYVLTSLFVAGIELACKGKTLNKTFEIFFTYFIGPESLVELKLGYKVGEKMYGMNEQQKKIFIKSLKETVTNYLNGLDNVSKGVAFKTPFVNTLLYYFNNDYSKSIVNLIVVMRQVSNFYAYLVNLLVLVVLVIIEPHVVVQVLVCFIRKQMLKFEFAKNMLKKNFEKGVNGVKISKSFEFTVDMLVSPSVLDTYRLGSFISEKGV
ncbi:hypothetical protein, partial [Brevibacillus sp. MCWH]|uniref:hypothetical protein n=1 Tax=Brevibacillus sp. MCWH TaxID=2508871 RepID=UPI0014923F64